MKLNRKTSRRSLKKAKASRRTRKNVQKGGGYPYCRFEFDNFKHGSGLGAHCKDHIGQQLTKAQIQNLVIDLKLSLNNVESICKNFAYLNGYILQLYGYYVYTNKKINRGVSVKRTDYEKKDGLLINICVVMLILTEYIYHLRLKHITDQHINQYFNEALVSLGISGTYQANISDTSNVNKVFEALKKHFIDLIGELIDVAVYKKGIKKGIIHGKELNIKTILTFPNDKGCIDVKEFDSTTIEPFKYIEKVLSEKIKSMQKEEPYYSITENNLKQHKIYADLCVGLLFPNYMPPNNGANFIIVTVMSDQYQPEITENTDVLYYFIDSSSRTVATSSMRTGRSAARNNEIVTLTSGLSLGEEA